MEGGHSGAKTVKNWAYRQYQESKDKSRFIALAQKLAQHLNNLTQDSNSRVRWLWELIQNAKDVPNEFDKCKIRIEIHDDKLIFYHNGDPFRVSDLESLVAQYSSKPEENKTHSETTGKYGTGFITTYILSRKIKIKGLLTMDTSQKQTEKPDAQTQGENEEDVFDEDQFQTPKGSSKGEKAQEENFYQKFEISLDRTYRDRDKELCMKLMRTQQNLMEDLLKNEPKPKWQRKENELNTQFIYEELDNAAHEMIEEAMVNLKELFPYALLFNPKLSELAVVNKTGGKRIKNFKISRLDKEKLYGLQIFNARFQEEQKGPYTFSAAFMEDRGSSSIIAVPIEVNSQKNIKLLETNGQFPKIFKEFPLIGSQDHGFNFVFSSRRFYPNQTRSDLLLKKIEGRPSPKTRSNWEALNGIFTKGLQLYIKLSEVISEGQQNLLIVALENQFINGEFEGNHLTKLFQIYQDKVSSLKCIQFKNKKAGGLNSLIFPKDEGEGKTLKAQDYSSELNKVFSSILGEQQTLSDENHKKFFQKLQKYEKTWEMTSIKYIKTVECVQILAGKGYDKLKQHFNSSEDLVLDLLSQIYQFLSKNNPSMMTQGKDNHISFVLTNDRVFKNINQIVNNQKIMVKESLPLAYQEIALCLDLKINSYTIYDAFAEHFKNVKKFNLDSMFYLYKWVLNVPYKDVKNVFEDNKFNQGKIIQLGRFLMSFKIECECMELISKFVVFHNKIKPFEMSDERNIDLPKQAKDLYTSLFTSKCMRYINDITTQNSNLKKFKMLTIYKNNQTEEMALKVLSQIYQFFSKKNASIMTQGLENKFSFVLTNDKGFKNINETVDKHKIMVKDNLPQAHQEIAKCLGIKISSYTIYDAFAENFKKVKKFNVDSMLQLYKAVLNVPYQDKKAPGKNKFNEDKIIQLGRFLMSFKVECECMNLISNLRVFHKKIKPFEMSNEWHIDLPKETKDLYTYLFTFKCIMYINDMTHQNSSLQQISYMFIEQYCEYIIQWWNQVLIFEKKLLSNKQFLFYSNSKNFCHEQKKFSNNFLDNQLTMNQKFTPNHKVHHFATKRGKNMVRIDPPNLKDAKFYEHIRPLWNRINRQKAEEEKNRQSSYFSSIYRFSEKESLSERIVHQKVRHKIFQPITYDSQFNMAIQVYNDDSIRNEQKVFILNYIYDLRQEAKEKDKRNNEKEDHIDLTEKLKIFEQIEKNAFYEYPKYINCVKKFEQKVFAFYFVKNPEQIEAAIELSEKYGKLSKVLEEIKRLEILEKVLKDKI